MERKTKVSKMRMKWDDKMRGYDDQREILGRVYTNHLVSSLYIDIDCQTNIPARDYE